MSVKRSIVRLKEELERLYFSQTVSAQKAPLVLEPIITLSVPQSMDGGRLEINFCTTSPSFFSQRKRERPSIL